ncbi:MAG: Hpt domain-containing protein [Aestuariivita sp.]|nr:Hpt domain-containing protein [Aestuariivita sp.]
MIDWDRVNSLRNDIGAEAFDEVVEIFLEEVQEIIDKLRDAPVIADLEHDLHSLKNGALNLGFADLSSLCLKGEREAAAGQADQFDLTQVVRLFDTARAQFLDELPRRLAA